MTTKTQSVIINNDTTKEHLQQLLKNMKPGLSNGSLTTYSSTLFNINYDKKTKTRDMDLILDNTKDIIDYIKIRYAHKNNTKNIFAALNTLTGYEEYRNEMNKETVKINAIQAQQVKSQNQEANWIEYEDTVKIYEEYGNKIWYISRRALRKNKELTKKQFRDFKEFLIFLVCSGRFMEPRRNLDWIEMYWKKPDDEELAKKVNYIDFKNWNFVFNTFKTCRKEGQQIVEMPFEIRNWLKRYRRFCKTDLLFTTDLAEIKLSTQLFNHKLHNFFKNINGKKISSNILRQSYLSWLYRDLPKLADMEKTAYNMGHSVMTALKYYVKHTIGEEHLQLKNKEPDSDEED